MWKRIYENKKIGTQISNNIFKKYKNTQNIYRFFL